MAVRNIVLIDEEKCDGCGLCIDSCAESAIELVDGKARLVSDNYCDGLGACLGTCPQDAITVIQREAVEFDEEAVKERQETLKTDGGSDEPLACGCPSSAMQSLGGGCPGSAVRDTGCGCPSGGECDSAPAPSGGSKLSHWPVQIKLVPPSAPFLKGADLLIAADCSAFALADIHRRYLQNRAVLVGCPKLDDLEFYRGRLADVFKEARPASVTVLRMEVPCCTGIATVTREALEKTRPGTPLEIHTLALSGDKIDVEIVN